MSVDKMMGLLLRVGIDKGTGGSLAPIFQDESFEYIPTPETRATSESNVYKSMKRRCSKSLTGFVKKNIGTLIRIVTPSLQHILMETQLLPNEINYPNYPQEVC